MHRRIAVGLLFALTATPVMAVEPSPAKHLPSPVATPAKVSEAAKPKKVAVTQPGGHHGVAENTARHAAAVSAPGTVAVKPPATTVTNPAKQ